MIDKKVGETDARRLTNGITPLLRMRKFALPLGMGKAFLKFLAGWGVLFQEKGHVAFIGSSHLSKQG